MQGLGNDTFKDILTETLFSELGMTLEQTRIESLKGGNNRVFKIEDNQTRVVLKQYFHDNRMRLDREYGFLEFARENKIVNLPKPLFCDNDKNIACYSFVPGRKLFSEKITQAHMDQVLAFVKQINMDHNRFSKKGLGLKDAAEACFSVEDHFVLVENKIKRFFENHDQDEIDMKAIKFIEQTIVPCWERIKMSGASKLKKKIRSAQTIISPSDFGFHNILLDEHSNQLYFIDFEYSGWDDPVKMVCDFFCQVEIPVPIRFWDDFISNLMDIVPADTDFMSQIEQLMPVYRIKWCCIILNDFLNTERSRKKFASFDADKRLNQLEKANNYAEKYLVNK